MVWLPLLVSKEQEEISKTTTLTGWKRNDRMLKKRRKRQHVNIDELLSEFSDENTNPDVSSNSGGAEASATKQQVSFVSEDTTVPLPMMTLGQALTPSPLTSFAPVLSQPAEESSFDASRLIPTPSPLTPEELSGSSSISYITSGRPNVISPSPISVPPVEPPVSITATYPPEFSAPTTYSPYFVPLTSTSSPMISRQPVATAPWISSNKYPISQQSSADSSPIMGPKAPPVMRPAQSPEGTLGATSGSIKPIVTTKPTSYYYYYFPTVAPVPVVVRPVRPTAKKPLTGTTSSPTYSPTRIPTPSPPTVSPTYSPTRIPTPSPKFRPTPIQTSSPIRYPTSDTPTYNPTAIPTPS